MQNSRVEMPYQILRPKRNFIAFWQCDKSVFALMNQFLWRVKIIGLTNANYSR